MTPTVKNILIAAGLFMAGSALLAYKKVTNLTSIFEQMTIRPNSLPKRVQVNLTNISFDIDVKLHNPTAEDFAVSGYVATLKRINVFFKGRFIGIANTDLNEVTVPKLDTMILHDINVVVATNVLIDNMTVLAPQLLEGNINMNDLVFTGIIEVMGVEYEVGA